MQRIVYIAAIGLVVTLLIVDLLSNKMLFQKLLFASLTAGWAFASTESPSSNIKHVPPQFFLNDGSKRVEVSYGPYTAPPASKMNGMKSFEEKSVQLPCTDCLITWMQADLRYTNGTTANANTGLWLHHTVMFNTAEQSLTVSINISPFKGTSISWTFIASTSGMAFQPLFCISHEPHTTANH